MLAWLPTVLIECCVHLGFPFGLRKEQNGSLFAVVLFAVLPCVQSGRVPELQILHLLWCLFCKSQDRS